MTVRTLSSFGLAMFACAGALSAQQLRFAGNGFRLSRQADFSSEDRVYAPTDTLHVEVSLLRLEDLGLPEVVAELDGASGSSAIALTLVAPSTYRGELPLEVLEPGAWTWTASVRSAGNELYAPSAALTIEAPPVPAIRYGMNASENAWYQRGIAFADALARASEFCTVVDGTITRDLVPTIALGEEPPLLGEGWPDASTLQPGERVGTRLFGSMAGSTPDGRETPYVLTWSGTGACSLEGPMVVGEQNRTANRVEFLVDPTVNSGNSLLIWVVDDPDPLDPVRDAHVWLPGMEATRPILWPPFVKKLAAMNAGAGPSTWRAMDWCRVNEVGRTDGSAPFVFDLAGRIKPSSPSQGTKRGVCPEFQVALCNALGVNLHVNLPHPANDIAIEDYDAFVVDTLTRIRDGAPAVPGLNGDQPFAGLAPGLTVTVELSNELWNPAFPARQWMQQQASANGHTLEEEIAAWVEHVFALARGVFAGPDAARLRTFVGGRINDASFLQDILAELATSGVEVDAIGPAAYFKPRAEDVTAWLADAVGQDCPNCPTPEAVVASARLAIPDLAPFLAAHRALAEAYANPDGSHPALELYEAGQAFVANNQPWWPAAAQAQRIPEMFAAYVDDFVPLLIKEGVDAVHWYSFVSDQDAHGGGTGPFGHWDRMDQTITLPVPEPYVDEGAPKAAVMCKGPPLEGE